MIVGDTWRIAYRWHLENQDCISVHHIRAISTTGAGATNDEMAIALEDTLYQITDDWNPAAATWRELIFICTYGIEIGTVIFSSVHNGDPGAAAPADGQAAKQLTGLITKRHPQAIRGNRGRTYCGFLTEVEASGGVASVGLQAQIADLANLIASGTTIVGAGGSTSFRFGLVPASDNTIFRLITSCAVSTKLATQRRRGDFGRPNP